MRLEPLYRARFTYPESWTVELAGEAGKEWQHLFLAEGRCEGRIAGTFRGANFPRRRPDNTFLPHLHGVIETDDGAAVLFDWNGYGRAYPVGARQIVGSGFHYCDREEYRWLNDSVAVLAGEVRTRADGAIVELLVDAAELVWEPIAE